MVDRFEKFSYAISQLHNYLHKITRDEMEAYGMKGPHAVYLFALYRFPEGVTGADLAEICFRNKADVSRAMSFFEEKGFVVRRGFSSNSYRAQIVLTELGRRAAEKLRARAMVVIHRAGQGLSDEKRAVFYEAMELIATNMSALCSASERAEASVDE